MSEQSGYGWANKIVNGVFKTRSRAERRAQGNLGIINLTGGANVQVFRDQKLEKFDAYYESRQYESKPEWDRASDPNGEHIPVRSRKPRFVFPFSKTLSQRLTAKLIGNSVFPTFTVEDAPDDQAFLEAVVRESKLRAFLLEPIRRMANTGSVFIRFYITDGAYKLEWYHSKFCYPTFQANGELESVVIKYLFDDGEDKDSSGNPKKKWFKMELGSTSEILFDTPEYVENEEPIFNEVDRVDHGLGFVQGEWLKTSEDHNSIDGYGLVSDIMEFVDELSYSLSQSSQSVGYNQDPQLVLKGLDEEGLGSLIRSAMKAWNLGHNGEAKFLESGLGGVERAIELRDKVQQNIQDIARIVLLDPEKIVGSAQSAKAMEILHGPLKDLIDELRSVIQDHLKNLVLKMGLACLSASTSGIPTPVMIPEGWVPQSLSIVVEWPPIFQQTMEDLQKKIQVVSAATAANILSRKTATLWIAKDFGISDVEAEIAEINSQPVLNPFGTF